ncbi:glycosyltransferase [Muriicola marianensis]|uniref:Glycosyltransferase 2-like domain-containing protein n=1 Tax=Muriicola marianensis TaxID=1324801 RepID=A0ABQ1QS04_9FLAO|nr:glycosyltransferase [Muriicola marianensis]GGD40799.1 hypothetical protein GCM10011361_04910 [Muriicola marianensis]
MILSVVIPIYNSANYLPYCMGSLSAQNLSDEEWEVILLNDGSTDTSGELCKQYEQAHSFVSYYQHPNMGVGATRNRGLSLAKGAYVYFLDPDDYIADGTLRMLLLLLQENRPEVLTFSSKSVKEYDLSASQISGEQVKNEEIIDGDTYISKYKFKNEIWWYLVQKDFLIRNDLRFIEGRWMEDAILTAQILLKAKRILKTNLDVHRHVRVPFSAMTNRETKHYLKVIHDNVHAVSVYHTEILGNLARSCSAETIERLKIRQESLSFFLIIRALRSKMSYDEIISILNRLKAYDAYPLRNFISEDYPALSYKILVPVINNKYLLRLVFYGYRSLSMRFNF